MSVSGSGKKLARGNATLISKLALRSVKHFAERLLTDYWFLRYENDNTCYRSLNIRSRLWKPARMILTLHQRGSVMGTHLRRIQSGLPCLSRAVTCVQHFSWHIANWLFVSVCCWDCSAGNRLVFQGGRSSAAVIGEI